MADTKQENSLNIQKFQTKFKEAISDKKVTTDELVKLREEYDKVKNEISESTKNEIDGFLESTAKTMLTGGGFEIRDPVKDAIFLKKNLKFNETTVNRIMKNYNENGGKGVVYSEDFDNKNILYFAKSKWSSGSNFFWRTGIIDSNSESIIRVENALNNELKGKQKETPISTDPKVAAPETPKPAVKSSKKAEKKQGESVKTSAEVTDFKAGNYTVTLKKGHINVHPEGDGSKTIDQLNNGVFVKATGKILDMRIKGKKYKCAEINYGAGKTGFVAIKYLGKQSEAIKQTAPAVTSPKKPETAPAVTSPKKPETSEPKLYASVLENVKAGKKVEVARYTFKRTDLIKTYTYEDRDLNKDPSIKFEMDKETQLFSKSETYENNFELYEKDRKYILEMNKGIASSEKHSFNTVPTKDELKKKIDEMKEKNIDKENKEEIKEEITITYTI